jgi:hypothetical protein
MRLVGQPYNLLKDSEISAIHKGALRILAEMGMEIQNDRLLEACVAAGYQVDRSVQRVRFPAPVVERFLAEAECFDWENLTPSVTSTAGVYHGRYHDPASGELLDWTEERLAQYFALARLLPNVTACCLAAGFQSRPRSNRFTSAIAVGNTARSKAARLTWTKSAPGCSNSTR